MLLTLASFKSENTYLFNTSKRIVLAYSGGLDSSVLLHLLINSFPKEQLLVWHVNHQLQKNSSKMEKFCEDQSNQYRLDYQCTPLSLTHLKSNIESEARNARYNAFNQHLRLDSDILLTAHHADDQLETLLLNLSRGSGVQGLRGVARQVINDNLNCVRPLLSFTRDELFVYAKNNKIQWTEDITNAECSFDRNYIRHKVFPNLKERWPLISQSFLLASEHQVEASECLEDLAKIDFKQCAESSIFSNRSILNLSYVKRLSMARLKNLLRYYLSLYEIQLTYHQAIQIAEIISKYDGGVKKSLINNGFIGLFDTQLFIVLDSDILSKTEIGEWLNTSKKNYVGRQNSAENQITKHFLKRQFQSRRVPPWLREQTLFLLNDDLKKNHLKMLIL